MIVADTDVLIDYLNDKGPAARRVEQALESEDLRTTVISRFELLSGARSPERHARLLRLLEAIPALPLDSHGADGAAAIRRSLEAEGRGIGEADSLIAGIVLQYSAELLTRNKRHFERVRGLRLVEFDGD